MAHFQEPQKLTDRGIRRQRQSADILEPIGAETSLQLPNQGLRSRVCPHNGVVQWLSGFVSTENRRLPLVSYADRFDAVNRMALFHEGRYRPINAFPDRGDDLERIVFMPAKGL